MDRPHLLQRTNEAAVRYSLGSPGGPDGSVSIGPAKGVVRDLHPQQLPEPFAPSEPANLFGSLSNFVLHPAEQKWYVFPACCEEPAAWLGSTCIPQTGSVCVVVVCVVIIDFLSISVAVKGASGWSIQHCGGAPSGRGPKSTSRRRQFQTQYGTRDIKTPSKRKPKIQARKLAT